MKFIFLIQESTESNQCQSMEGIECNFASGSKNSRRRSSRGRGGERKKEAAPHDLHADNDSPAVYSRWAFNLGSWSSHDADDDAAASCPCRSSILAAEKRLALLATGRTRRARGNDLLPSSLFRRHPRFFPLPSSPSIIPFPGKILLQRLANAKRQVSRDSPESCSNADGRTRRGPHEFPPLRAPQTPHRWLCQVRSGVNSLLDFRSTIV